VTARSYVVGLPVVVTVEDGPPWENSPRVTYEVDTSEAGREVGRSDDPGYPEEDVAKDVAVIDADHSNRVELRRSMAERTEHIVLAESKIGRLITALKEDGWQPSWYNTGGGCMVVHVPLGDGEAAVLIGEGGPPHGPDAFGFNDLDSNENVSGIWFASREDEEGEPVEEPLVLAGTTEDVLAAIRPLRQVWDTATLQADFDVLGFQAPFVVVRKKRTGEKGSLQFEHSPRVYFGWKPDSE
jgi:hypothetical protein